MNLENFKSDFLRNIKKLLVNLFLLFLPKVEKKTNLKKLPKSIVILAQERLGDSILLTPLLKNLKKKIPDVQISLVVFSKDSFNFFVDDKNVDKLFYLKKNYLKYLIEIRKKNFDLLFSTKDHFSFTFLIITSLINAKFKVGIAHKNHKNFFNHLIDFDFYEHIIEKNCALLKFLNLPMDKSNCRPYLLRTGKVKNEIITFAETELKNKKIMGINLSAGEISREWSTQKWREFISEIDMPVIIFSMPNRANDKKILEELFINVIHSPKTSSIYDAAFLIEKLSILITPDTSLIHIASAYNVPVVGLYRNNPLHYKRFYPYLVRHQKVISETGDIENISVNAVVSAFNKVVKD